MKFSLHKIKDNCILNRAGVFEGRPFVFCACIAFLLLTLCIFTNLYIRTICAILCIACFVYFILRKRPNGKFGDYTRAVYVLAAIMSFVLCIRTVYHFDVQNAECGKYVSDDAVITAYAVPDGNGKIMITDINGTSVSYYGILYGAYLPDAYEEFTCTGKLNTVKTNSFSGSTYYIGNNVSFTVKSEEINESGRLAKTPYAEFYKINRYIRSAIYDHCDENPGMISGIFLGNKDDIPTNVNADFLKTGISHIIAVSGLHVIAALALLSFILNKTVPKISIRAVILIFAALFYALITGCMYSVMRAAIMYTVLNLSVVLFRKNDSLTSLFISLYLILLFEPYALLDLSLQLSAVSTFGIIVFAAPLCKRIDMCDLLSGKAKIKQAAKYSAKSVIISVCATLPLVPISAYYFGKISLASPLMTLVISPFVLLILYTAPFTAVFGFSDALANLVGQICDSCAEISTDLASFGARHLDFTLSLKYSFSAYIIITACAVTVILIFSGINKKRIYAGLGAILVSVYFISVGIYRLADTDTDNIIYSCASDDVICRIKDNRAVAVDVTDGSISSYDLLFDELYEHGILSLDTLIMTKCGENHSKLIRNLYADYGIDNLILPENDRYSENVSVTAEELGISFSFYDGDKGFSSVHDELEISPVYYLNDTKGCNVSWDGVLYASGRTSDIDTSRNISVFMYGTASDVPESTVIPIENTSLALIPSEVKDDMFYASEFEEYQQRVNTRVFGNIAVIDMNTLRE